MTAQKKPNQKPESGQAANDDKQAEAAQETEQKTYSALDEAIAQEQEQAKEGEWEPAAANDGQGAKRKLGNDELQKMLTMLFGVVALRAGDHWKLSDPEAQGLSEAINDAAREYFGEDVEMGPYLALAVTAGMVTVPRYMITVAQQQEQQGAGNQSQNQKETGKEGGSGGD